MTVSQLWGGHQQGRRVGGGRDRRSLGLRTVDKERNMAGWKSWYVAKAAVWDRKRWSENMTTLCAYWRNERRC